MDTQDWNDVGRLVGSLLMPIVGVFDEAYRAEIVEGLRWHRSPAGIPALRKTTSDFVVPNYGRQGLSLKISGQIQVLRHGKV